MPNAWGFLLFCAAWTVLVVAFQFTANATERTVLAYIRIVVEVVALLSWFAGWIAVAVNIRTGACVSRFVGCEALEVATVFGAVEWLLFMGTAGWSISVFWGNKSRLGKSEV